MDPDEVTQPDPDILDPSSEAENENPEPEENEELDDAGNPVGTLYYADGTVYEPPTAPEPAPPAPTRQEQAQQPQAPPTGYRPQISARMTDAERELIDPDVVKVLEGYGERIMQQAAALASASSTNVAVASAQYGRLFEVKGNEIRETLASLPPSQQADPKAMQVAILGTIMREAEQTGDFVGAMRRVNELLGGGSPPVKPVDNTPRVAPGARIPASSAASGPAHRGRPSSGERMKNLHGLSDAELALLMSDPLIG